MLNFFFLFKRFQSCVTTGSGCVQKPCKYDIRQQTFETVILSAVVHTNSLPVQFKLVYIILYVYV